MILNADVLDGMRQMPDASVQCVVTSPPYWSLRDYGVPGQIGSEPTIAEYVAKMVEVFREVRRVLKKDGVVWLNLGDTYAGSWGAQGGPSNLTVPPVGVYSEKSPTRNAKRIGLKPKDRCMIPARVAIALQDDGWWLRDEIIWHKPNPMPSSVRDRTTPAHEMIYLLSKSKRYYYNAAAIRTVFSAETKQLSHDTMDFKRREKYKMPDGWDTGPGAHGSVHRNGREKGMPAGFKGSIPGRKDGPGQDRREKGDRSDAPEGANARSVWSIATEAFPEAHFATFPREIPRRCILAGSRPGDVVLDPFAGSGTTLEVALSYGRIPWGIELNPEYMAMIEKRLSGVTPPLLEVA